MESQTRQGKREEKKMKLRVKNGRERKEEKGRGGCCREDRGRHDLTRVPRIVHSI